MERDREMRMIIKQKMRRKKRMSLETQNEHGQSGYTDSQKACITYQSVSPGFVRKE